MTGRQKKPNKLVNEKSPYLLQHAYNPVEWYPWSDEAFEKARKENKPIFLSIGYSTCHWCHVMEKESFEDPDVANLLNQNLISIKVDREERPDIDNVYMTVCQMLTGSGGWPLTIIMTPDKKPFFSGTYFPKQSNVGRIGMMDLIPKIAEIWVTKKEDVLTSAENITKTLNEYSIIKLREELSFNVIEDAYKQLRASFDGLNGGFGSAPKFPTPHNLLLLLRYWKRTKDENALHMVEKTLQAMVVGGIYDHIGYGFHRYSTDEKWLLPHFEKMLYDQAMISYALVETFQATGKLFYSQIAREIYSYVIRDMTSVEGGFYSAEDADSEGEEGKFYIWYYDEISGVLSEDEMKLFAENFLIDKSGNYIDEVSHSRTGRNIIVRKNFDSFNQNDINKIRERLFKKRESRIHPHKDDKVLTSWNGLMIASLAKASRAFNEPVYTERARKAADFILSTMYKDKILYHVYREGELKIPGHADDYAFFILGLLELYQSTFEIKYLKHAIELNNELINNFWDENNGGFYFTAKNEKELIVRMKESNDGAIPSGNSIAILNMCIISSLTGDAELKNKALKAVSVFSANIKQIPIAYTFLLSALDYILGPSNEIVIVGNSNASDTRSMINYLNNQFYPNSVILFKDSNNGKDIVEIAKFTEKYCSIDSKCTAYVCKDYSCSLPVTSVDDLDKVINL